MSYNYLVKNPSVLLQRGRLLLQSFKAPDHATINRFRNTLEECSSDLLTQLIEELNLQEGSSLEYVKESIEKASVFT